MKKLIIVGSSGNRGLMFFTSYSGKSGKDFFCTSFISFDLFLIWSRQEDNLQFTEVDNERKMPVERSANVAATPETIWNTCFVPMKLESWDPDLKDMIDVTGGCENGTTCTFVMKDGLNVPTTLSNVEKNKSLTFSGGMAGGLLKFEGNILITPVDASNSKIDYKYVYSVLYKCLLLHSILD